MTRGLTVASHPHPHTSRIPEVVTVVGLSKHGIYLHTKWDFRIVDWGPCCRVTLRVCLHGLTFTWWGCCGFCRRHKATELAFSFLFCLCVCFCFYSPFNYIPFHKFSRQLSAFSLCSSGLNSALLVLSTVRLFMKISLSPNTVICGWLGLKHLA